MKKLFKRGYEKDLFVTDLVNIAYRRGGMDFVTTLDCENGTRDPTRRSNQIGANGHWDRGLCQLNYGYHADFIDSKEFKNPYTQLARCSNMYKDYKKRGILHIRFFGYNNRHKCRNNFYFKTIEKEVKIIISK